MPVISPSEDDGRRKGNAGEACDEIDPVCRSRWQPDLRQLFSRDHQAQRETCENNETFGRLLGHQSQDGQTEGRLSSPYRTKCPTLSPYGKDEIRRRIPRLAVSARRITATMNRAMRLAAANGRIVFGFIQARAYLVSTREWQETGCLWVMRIAFLREARRQPGFSSCLNLPWTSWPLRSPCYAAVIRIRLRSNCVAALALCTSCPVLSARPWVLSYDSN